MWMKVWYVDLEPRDTDDPTTGQKQNRVRALATALLPDDEYFTGCEVIRYSVPREYAEASSHIPTMRRYASSKNITVEYDNWDEENNCFKGKTQKPRFSGRSWKERALHDETYKWCQLFMADLKKRMPNHEGSVDYYVNLPDLEKGIVVIEERIPFKTRALDLVQNTQNATRGWLPWLSISSLVIVLLLIFFVFPAINISALKSPPLIPPPGTIMVEENDLVAVSTMPDAIPFIVTKNGWLKEGDDVSFLGEYGRIQQISSSTVTLIMPQGETRTINLPGAWAWGHSPLSNGTFFAFPGNNLGQILLAISEVYAVDVVIPRNDGCLSGNLSPHNLEELIESTGKYLGLSYNVAEKRIQTDEQVSRFYVGFYGLLSSITLRTPAEYVALMQMHSPHRLIVLEGDGGAPFVGQPQLQSYAEKRGLRIFETEDEIHLGDL